MNNCARCKRYLNGALSCAGCGMMVGGSDDHPTLPLPKIRVQEMVPLPEPTGPKVQLPPQRNAAQAREPMQQADQVKAEQAQQPQPQSGQTPQLPNVPRSEAPQGVAPQRQAPQAVVPLAAGPNQTAAPSSSIPDRASAQVPESALEQTRHSTLAPVPAATPAAPPTPDSAQAQAPEQAQEHAPVWVGASDAILKFESELASGLTPMPRPKSKPKPRPKPEQASPSAEKPSPATDPEEARPTLIPVPVPLSIPNSPHPLATPASSATGTPNPADSDEYIKLEEVGIGISGTAGHRADDERSRRGLSRKSTGVLVGTAAVVAVVAGAVVFSSSPTSPKASTPPSQTGLVVLPTMAATGPQVVTDRQSGAAGQSAAPNPATARPAPSASAKPTAGNGPDIIAPSPTPTPTTIPKAPKTTSPPAVNPFTITASKYSNSRNVGTETTTDTGGGQDVGWITNGSWLAYDGINFPSGMAGRIQVRLASVLTTADVGTIQFRLNSPYASVFATVTVNGTGGWQNWTTSSTGESPIPSGTYTLYVTFSTSTGGDFVNVNWFQFS